MRTSSFILLCSLVFGIALLFLDIPAWADNSIGGATLKGIKAVAVVVEEMRADAEGDGLTRSQLQTDVELRLRQAGIPVDNDAPGVLYLAVNTVKSQGGFYAYVIGVEFAQGVLLARDPSITTFDTTWRAIPGVGIINAINLHTVRDDVRDQVDEFINAYLEQNPRQ